MGWIIALIVVAVLAGLLVLLYFLGKKAQKRQETQQAQIEQYKQTVSMLIIDKKRMRLNESGLPQSVIDQTPKSLRWQKLPVVKAKVGPQMVTMIADDKIFPDLPVKKEIKAGVSGLYIVDFKGAHGKLAAPEKKKKKGPAAWIEKLQEKAGAKPLK